MANNIAITEGAGKSVATEEIDAGTGLAQVQYHKLVHGAVGTATLVGTGNPLPMRNMPFASGGPTPFSVSSAASTNATNVKPSNGQVYLLAVTNNGTSEAYIRIYNKASAPNPSTDSALIVWRMMIPASSGFTQEFVGGLPCGTGIGFAVSTGATDTSTGSVAANQLQINLTWK